MTNNDFKIISHDNKSIIKELRKLIESDFHKDLDYYNHLEINEFRNLVANTQNQINSEDYGKKLIKSVLNGIKKTTGNDEILIQSNVYLRAARPNLNQNFENIGWHRESFYGPNMDKAYNVWTPIKGVNENNTLNYVPGSQYIDLKDIKFTTEQDKKTERFSAGHKIGFLYAPKKIISGVDTENSLPMIVPYYSSSLFDANLIHGAGNNNSNEIRFSIDLRIIKKKHYNSNLNKNSHFASGKEYFVSI